MSRDTLISLAVALLTMLLFAQVRDHEFINYDDPGYVKVPIVQRGLTPEGVRWAFTTMQFANYHPLTWLSHMADVSMFGNNAGGHHVVSVAIHAVNAAVLYLVLRAMTGRTLPSVVVAGVWAVHPLRVESVAWVAERKDLLCGLFFLLSIAAYARYARRRRRPMLAYAAALVCYALALMSKSMAVTLPCVLLLLDFWPLRRQDRWRTLVLDKVPFFLLTIAFAVLTMIAQRQGGAMEAGESLPLWLRLGNALASYARYVELTFWPHGLAFFYPYHGALPGTKLPSWRVAAGALLLVGATALAMRLWRRERAALVGWLWFVGMLVPVIGVVQVGLQSMADRYTYLPQIGLLIAIVWPAYTLLETTAAKRRAWFGVAAAASGVVLIALSFRTHVELQHWRNNFTLFTRALAVTTHNAVAHSALALALEESKQIPAAIDHYKRAILITPKEPQLYYNIGRIHLIQGNLPLAENWLGKALSYDPNEIDALINLAKAQSGLGRSADAEQTLRRAIEVDPNNAVAHYDLGVELAERGDVKGALPHFAEAVRIEPDVPELHFSYSLALRQLGENERADSAYQRYVEIARRRGVAPLPIPATNPDNRPRQR